MTELLSSIQRDRKSLRTRIAIRLQIVVANNIISLAWANSDWPPGGFIQENIENSINKSMNAVGTCYYQKLCSCSIIYRQQCDYLGPVDLLRIRGIALSNCCQPSELTEVPSKWMASSLGNVAKTAID